MKGGNGYVCQSSNGFSPPMIDQSASDTDEDGNVFKKHYLWGNLSGFNEAIFHQSRIFRTGALDGNHLECGYYEDDWWDMMDLAIK